MPVRGVAVTNHTDKAWYGPFLDGLRQGMAPGAAAEAAGLSRKTAYDYRQRDPDFAAAWEDAIQSAVDGGETEAYRRGVLGVEREKPHLYRGTVVHVERYREYSDAALFRWLGAHRPHKWRDDRPGGDAASVNVTIYLPDNNRPNTQAIELVAPSHPALPAATDTPSSSNPEPKSERATPS